MQKKGFLTAPSETEKEKADSSVKAASVDKDTNPSEAKPPEVLKKKPNPALKPIYVNGVEVQIDPETGAKRFEIKSKWDKN